jgi:hypothetical protein
VQKLKQLSLGLAKYASQHNRFVNKKSLSEFVGFAISLSAAIPAARFKLLPLYDAINQVSSWSNNVAVRLSNAGYRVLKYFWT